MGKLLRKLQVSFDFWLVLAMGVVLFFLRLPSFFEPYWYGDEGIYEIIGFALRNGRLLYRDIWDNKPPLLYLIYAIFAGDQTGAKVLSFVAGMAALIFFFLLCKKLFTAKFPVILATLVFTLLIGLPLLEGNIANAENFMLLPITAGAYLVTSYLQNKQKNLLYIALAGIIFGLSFLVKVVGVFDLAAFFVVIALWYLLDGKVRWGKLFQTLTTLILGFAIPFVLTCVFFFATGSFKTFVQSAFLSNVGYVNYGNQIFFPFTHTAIPQGLLLVKLLILACILSFILIKRKSLTFLHIVVFVWLSFSIFNALFSQRPYTHYVLVLVPSFCLLVGSLFQEKRLRIFSTLLALALLVFVYKNFWLSDRSISYYQNFFSYISGHKSTAAYQTYFDKVTPRDYAVADFLSIHTQPAEVIFIWGNSGQIYKLTNTLPPGRYTVEYHVTTNQSTLQETAADLRRTMPRFVVVLANASPLPYRLVHYQPRFSVEGATIYERTY